MSKGSTAQATAPPPSASELARSRAAIKLPGENLTIAETLRVMDVARQMRDERATAEELFRQDDVRTRLREKLLRTAQMSGDTVTSAEIDAAIDQYLAQLHTYENPAKGISKFWAYCWIWRTRIAIAASTVAVSGAAVWFSFF